MGVLPENTMFVPANRFGTLSRDGGETRPIGEVSFWKHYPQGDPRTLPTYFGVKARPCGMPRINVEDQQCGLGGAE